MSITQMILTGIWAIIIPLFLTYSCMKMKSPSTMRTTILIATIYFTLLVGGMIGIIYAPW